MTQMLFSHDLELAARVWPSNISVVAKYAPEYLTYFQGEMDVCEECCKPFRRLTDKTICAHCRPLVDAAKPAYGS